MVGKDFRLYRKTRGLMSIICETDPVDETKPALYYEGVKWDQYPEMGWLVDLYDRFFSQYKREVMIVVGKRYRVEEGKCPWFFMVPAQVGTPGSIEWKDKEGMDWFLQQARFLGTVHIHPGTGTGPSSVDLDHWKEKDCSGIHVIFGRDGGFSIYGSASGHCVHISDGTTKDVERKRAPLCTSRNKKLESLLLIPPPPKPLKVRKHALCPVQFQRGKKHGSGILDETQRWLDGMEQRFDKYPYLESNEWEDYLHSAALMSVWDESALHDATELWLVVDGRDAHIMDPFDYEKYRDLCLVRGWHDAPIGIRFVPEKGGA
jgi:proteasome lid subunit RPN8/RPN11